MYFIPNANYGSADKTWLFQHQIDELIIAQFIPFQAELLEAQASEVKYLGSWFLLEQLSYLTAIKRILEEIPFVDCHVLLPFY